MSPVAFWPPLPPPHSGGAVPLPGSPLRPPPVLDYSPPSALLADIGGTFPSSLPWSSSFAYSLLAPCIVLPRVFRVDVVPSLRSPPPSPCPALPSLAADISPPPPFLRLALPAAWSFYMLIIYCARVHIGLL